MGEYNLFTQQPAWEVVYVVSNTTKGATPCRVAL